jgi:hypothetical protein
MAAQAREKKPPDGEGFPWEITGAELAHSLLGEAEKSQHDRYKLVADVLDVLGNPKRVYAQLYEVVQISGYSSWNWTPMMWKLRLMLELEDCTDARSQKRWEFDPAGDFVYEFLRLQADHNWETTRKGIKGFGMIGSLNGVLLFPEALRYFISKIDKETLRAGPVAA